MKYNTAEERVDAALDLAKRLVGMLEAREIGLFSWWEMTGRLEAQLHEVFNPKEVKP